LQRLCFRRTQPGRPRRSLRAAQTTVPPGVPELDAQLSVAAKSLNDVTEDLQQISRGVHPAILSKGGIGPAIKMLARRSPVPVELDIRNGGRLPDWLEVAAFYVVSEALTNAAKHAQATVVRVAFGIEDVIDQRDDSDCAFGGANRPSRTAAPIG
jgi:signal transduction histidine kinase